MKSWRASLDSRFRAAIPRGVGAAARDHIRCHLDRPPQDGHRKSSRPRSYLFLEAFKDGDWVTWRGNVGLVRKESRGYADPVHRIVYFGSIRYSETHWYTKYRGKYQHYYFCARTPKDIQGIQLLDEASADEVKAKWRRLLSEDLIVDPPAWLPEYLGQTTDPVIAKALGMDT